MRCPKCGFVGFDHLEKCLKCSRDLTAARVELNLQDFKPEVPFLLGSLVGEMQGGGGGAQQELSLTQETELELGGFETSESQTTEGSIDMKDFGGLPDAGSADEVNLSEIALDDLETIEASAMGDAGSAEEDDGFLGLEFDMDDSSLDDLGVLEESAAAEPKAATASPGEELELELNEDDLSELAKELEGHLDAEAGAKKKGAADGQGEVILEMDDD
jgi:hypothetical protein